jgi:phage tail-like protein
MAEEQAYPIPSFLFEVSVSTLGSMTFSEASGLTRENDLIEYNHGMNKSFSPLKMPGRQKYSNVTLKRGIITGENNFFTWISQNLWSVANRQSMVIQLMNQEMKPVVTWKLVSAWPLKIDGPSMNAGASEVAIETMEIAHEGFTIEHAS